MESLITNRIIHLDLKGAPPNIKFMERFIPFLKSIGATGILIEWEDTFPYSQELISIGSLNPRNVGPYSCQDALRILELATQAGLTVIPLVQTIGHLEFVLKHEEWQALREVPEYPSSMCPTHPETLPFIRHLVTQVISFYPSIKYFHIGGDEVWHMALCDTCIKKMQKNKNGKDSIYLDYIIEVARYIRSVYPYINVIVWDDMLRNIDEDVLLESRIGEVVEIMIWHYGKVEGILSSSVWDKYINVFPNIWAASAFKGAGRSSQIIPVTTNYIENQECWLRTIIKYFERIKNFKGIALTGWSRFDHYATLCELLPVAIPTMCLCLRTWVPKSSPESSGVIGIQPGPSTSTSVYSPQDEYSFLGWQICKVMETLSKFRERCRKVLYGDELDTWFNSWQIENQYVNPIQIDVFIPSFTALNIELTSIEQNLVVHLPEYFYQHTMDEIIGTLVIPLKEQISKLQEECVRLRRLGCAIRPVPRNV